MNNVLYAKDFLLRKKSNDIADKIGRLLAIELNSLSKTQDITVGQIISVVNYICATLSINILYSTLDGLKKSFPGSDFKSDYLMVESNFIQAIKIINKEKREHINGRT